MKIIYLKSLKVKGREGLYIVRISIVKIKSIPTSLKMQCMSLTKNTTQEVIMKEMKGITMTGMQKRFLMIHLTNGKKRTDSNWVGFLMQVK